MAGGFCRISVANSLPVTFLSGVYLIVDNEIHKSIGKKISEKLIFFKIILFSKTEFQNFISPNCSKFFIECD